MIKLVCQCLSYIALVLVGLSASWPDVIHKATYLLQDCTDIQQVAVLRSGYCSITSYCTCLQYRLRQISQIDSNCKVSNQSLIIFARNQHAVAEHCNIKQTTLQDATSRCLHSSLVRRISSCQVTSTPTAHPSVG